MMCPRYRRSGSWIQALLSLCLLAPGVARADPPRVYPGRTWEKLDRPDKAGWSLEKLEAARQSAESFHSAAVLVVHGGKVVADWGQTARRYNVHSIRKSFLSALYGQYVKSGKIRLDDTLEKLGIDDNEPALTAAEKQATVADLLKARSGIYHPALYETDGMKRRRPARGSHAPGSFWYYNNWDFNALGTIFERATGQTVFEALQRQIAEPLQMEDFRPEDGTYVRGDDSIHPAYPLRMTARDMARFGLLFARGGRWRDRQVIPADWVGESTQSHSEAIDEEGKKRGGYGYMWWTEMDGLHVTNAQLPPGTFSARGAGGHYILVVPSLDLVIVNRMDTDKKDGPRMQNPQFGTLVQQILDAMPESRKR